MNAAELRAHLEDVIEQELKSLDRREHINYYEDTSNGGVTGFAVVTDDGEVVEITVGEQDG
jgi:hypothetical protein